MWGGTRLGFVFLCATQGWAQSPVVSTLDLTLNPAAPVKGRDAVANLDIVLGGLDQPPVLRANVGAIDSVERIAPGRFRARYRLPTTRFPEVAIIVAFAPWPHPQSVDGAFGVLRVPISSAVEVPGRAERDAELTLTLGENQFGPVRTHADGTFRLPVVVPPGYGMAKTVTVDRAGNRRVSALNLMLPPTDQLACVVTPNRLPADGVSKARLLCASSDPYGAPSRGARVQLKGARGSLSRARELGDGVQEWTWTAPRELGSGIEKLTANWKQGSVDSSEEVDIILSQGPVRSVSVIPEDIVAYQGAPWRAVVTARDAFDRPLAGVAISGAGVEAALTDQQGRASLLWSVKPTESLGKRTLQLRAHGPSGKDPAKLEAWSHEGGVWVSVTDLSGLPVPSQRLRMGALEFTTSSEGTVQISQSGELFLAEWPGLRLWVNVEGPNPPRAEVVTQVSLTVAPAPPVNVRVAKAGDGFSWWIESVQGEVLDGRTIDVTDSTGRRRLVSHGRTQERSIQGLVSITDVQSGVSAVVEAP